MTWLVIRILWRMMIDEWWCIRDSNRQKGYCGEAGVKWWRYFEFLIGRRKEYLQLGRSFSGCCLVPCFFLLLMKIYWFLSLFKCTVGDPIQRNWVGKYIWLKRTHGLKKVKKESQIKAVVLISWFGYFYF